MGPVVGERTAPQPLGHRACPQLRRWTARSDNESSSPWSSARPVRVRRLHIWQCCAAECRRVAGAGPLVCTVKQGEHTGAKHACTSSRRRGQPAEARLRGNQTKRAPCCTVTHLLASAGSLERALRRGLLHTRRSRRPRLQPLLALAQDVAEALAYLHDPAQRLVRARQRLPWPRRPAAPGAIAGAAWPAPGPPTICPSGLSSGRCTCTFFATLRSTPQRALLVPEAGELPALSELLFSAQASFEASAREDAEWRGARADAEAAGQVHGDLASSNVLLTRRGARGACGVLGVGRLRAKAPPLQNAGPCMQCFCSPAGLLRCCGEESMHRACMCLCQQRRESAVGMNLIR